MKRYFTFTTPPDVTAYHPNGRYHWMSLASGGYVCVLDSGSEPAPSWTELPHLLDSSRGAGLTDFGCLPTDTMFQTAQKLSAVNRYFRP
jgi:hypothetical protein